MRSYEKIQFIGHSINTGPRMIKNGAESIMTYVGDKDPVADLGKRTAFVRDVLGTAVNSTPVVPDDNVLKVFVLPEFFFCGQERAHEMRHVDNLLANLQSLVSNSRWKHWVFVFGTVLGSAQAEGDNDTDGYQYCLIQQGCEVNNTMKDDLVRMVMKEHIFENDFIEAEHNEDSCTLIWERIQHMLPPEQAGPGMEEQRNHYDGRGIFELAGITFGVEIGLDHAEGRLRRSPQLEGCREVQIQIMPSCGTEICSDAVTAVEDGWVFNCDGLNDCYTDLRKIIASSTYDPQQSAQLALYPQRPPCSIHTSCDVDELFVDGAGALHFYDPVTIPESKEAGGTETA